MKTLIIALEYPPQIGGIASYIYNLASHLNPAETIVYAPLQPAVSDWDKSNAWKTYRLKPYWIFWPRWIRLFLQVKKIVKAEKIQQLYIHHILPVGYIGWLIKKIYKIPYTLFFHGTDVAVSSRITKILQFRFICRSAERIVVNSNYLKTRLQSKVAGLTKIITINPAPADIFFKPAELISINNLKRDYGLSGRKVILTVARVNAGKGYFRLLKAFARAIESFPTAIWVVIGEGPKLDRLVKAAEKFKVSSSIRFIGRMPLRDLPVFYQSADVFALLTHPSHKAEEGWGTVFMEAAASGLPVVAGRAGGVEEAVLDGKTGIVVDADNENEVSTALINLFTDVAQAKAMGATAKARLVNEFTWKDQLKKLL